MCNIWTVPFKCFVLFSLCHMQTFMTHELFDAKFTLCLAGSCLSALCMHARFSVSRFTSYDIAVSFCFLFCC